jgi:arylsulfatase A-like enzyme
MSTLNRRGFLTGLAGAASAGAAGAQAARLPNIVLILADDLGYGDLGCYNPKSRIPTPSLDRLAAEGIRFTDAHTPSAVCTPARYGLLTGRYCWRTRLKQGVLDGFDPPLIESGRMTLASLAKSRGYDTACIGKWHLGIEWTAKDGAPVGQLRRPSPASGPATTWTTPGRSRVRCRPADRTVSGPAVAASRPVVSSPLATNVGQYRPGSIVMCTGRLRPGPA